MKIADNLGLKLWAKMERGETGGIGKQNIRACEPRGMCRMLRTLESFF